jgi:peptidoglycan hydrolase-like protein with peptidoglycan-binding domain
MPALGGYLVMEPAPSDRVEEAQRLLRAAGFEAGTPDGVYGRRTAEAIRRFQAGAGVAATGALSDQLLRQLRAASGQ